MTEKNAIYQEKKETLSFVQIGMEILRVARNELYLNMRFLDVALSSLRFVPDGQIRGLGTDGNNLYFMDCENDYRIAKVDLTNGEKTLVTDCRVDCYNVTGDKIFFQKNDKTNPAICCINTDGSNYQELKEGNYTAINVTSTYVYFKDFTTKTPYYTSVAAPGNVQIFNP